MTPLETPHLLEHLRNLHAHAAELLRLAMDLPTDSHIPEPLRRQLLEELIVMELGVSLAKEAVKAQKPPSDPGVDHA